MSSGASASTFGVLLIHLNYLFCCLPFGNLLCLLVHYADEVYLCSVLTVVGFCLQFNCKQGCCYLAGAHPHLELSWFNVIFNLYGSGSMYLLSCLVTENKYDPWGGGTVRSRGANGPLSPLLGVALAFGRIKEAFAQSTGTLIPRLGFCQLAALLRGVEPLGPASSTTSRFCRLTTHPRVQAAGGLIFNDGRFCQLTAHLRDASGWGPYLQRREVLPADRASP